MLTRPCPETTEIQPLATCTIRTWLGKKGGQGQVVFSTQPLEVLWRARGLGKLQGDPGISSSLQERWWTQPSWPGLAKVSPLDCPTLLVGGRGTLGLVQLVYVGECLVCLAFGCLLLRVLIGPWCRNVASLCWGGVLWAWLVALSPEPSKAVPLHPSLFFLCQGGRLNVPLEQ